MENTHTKLELEDFLQTSDSSSLYAPLLREEGFTFDEIMYIAHAYILPKDDFNVIVTEYRQESDERKKLRFISDLVKKYQVSETQIKRRIDEVRIMNIIIPWRSKTQNSSLDIIEKTLFKNYSEIGVGTKLNLEKYIVNLNKDGNKIFLYLVALKRNKALTYSDIMYLVYALLLPKEDFDEIIESYDSIKDSDVIEYYLGVLSQIYGCEKEIIKRRIVEVRELNAILSQNQEQEKIIHLI